MTLSPIVLFVYKRLWHTQQTVETLRKNELAGQSELYIYSDFPKDEKIKDQVAEVRKYLRKIKGFKKIQIIERNRHFGLANSIISGVTEVISKYGKVIVLEDDLVSSPLFLKYINEALNFYKNDKQIYSITGYCFPVKVPEFYKYSAYTFYRASSWGWGTWYDRWIKADWKVRDYDQFRKNFKAQDEFNKGGDDLTVLLEFQIKGKVDSWAIRWCYTHYKNNGLCLYPVISKIKNIGMDGSGTHRSIRKIYSLIDESRDDYIFPRNTKVDDEISKRINKHLNNDILRKIIYFIKRIV